MKYITTLAVLILFAVGCYGDTEKTETPHKSRAGKFVMVVRTADDNAQIDWFTAHSDMPAFWEKLGEKELEVWVLSEADKDNLVTKPEFAITAGIEYGYMLFEGLLETFETEFVQGKYKDYTIVRAWDEYGLLADFGITPKTLNVPYRWHASMEHIYAIHTTWWTATFALDAIVFQGEKFWEKYNSIPEGIERTRYYQQFRDAFSLTYSYGATKRDPIVHFYIAGTAGVMTDLVVSVACDRAQAVNVEIDGDFGKPRLVFMARDLNDFSVFSPSDPEGATITFNKLHIGSTFTPTDFGWSAVIRTRQKLASADIRVSENCEIENFESYPHMGGTFEATFDIVAEFESASVMYPGLKSPIIIIGDQVIRRGGHD